MTTIEASRGRVAAYHIPSLLSGCAFPAVYFFGIRPAENLPTWANGVFLIAAIFGAVLFALTLFKMLRVLSTKGRWRVSISEDRLIWETAVPNKQFPLDIPLSNIAELVRLETMTKGTDESTTVETTFEIHLHDGGHQTITQETAGINPHRVFDELKDRGIPYRRYELDQRTDPQNDVRIVQRD
ncbi:hypothetical protein [Actibacterium lipolyticum]|uniref:Uncharacterized protein n=1 Tax=Actibacterium lipolyticum TaxID=1524263 RepID=A0A238JVC8_9RHOB|nr:hypothetical protein [Actibacterium lipolyticum]SMX33706.1 hypothetical protein COL8621_01081 [Actibacterium lipolyticum]